MKKVGIIMGSDSDLPIIRKATNMLDTLEVPYEVHVYSAHRTPDEAADFAASAKANGFGVLIAAAGMAAAASVILFVPNLIIFVCMQSQVMNTMSHSGIK